MHPFGGTPICPRCSRAVYAAEQVMGPGRKLYHKPCLACTICNKRLDSYTLLEHDQQHKCSKSCHLKNFGTRDLRHANLPVALPPSDTTDDLPQPSPHTSPTKGTFPPRALLQPLHTGGGRGSATSSPLPRLRPNRSLATSPISPTFGRGPSPTSQYGFQMPSSSNGSGSGGAGGGGSNRSTPPINENPNPHTIQEEEEEVQDVLMADGDSEHEQEELDSARPSSSSSAANNSTYPSNTGRPGIGTIPRTIPLYLNGGGGYPSKTGYKHHTSHSVAAYSLSSPGAFANITPLRQTATGTRYGVALTGGVGSNVTGGGGGGGGGGGVGVGVGVHVTGSSARKWGAGTPVCPRCLKSVYFAEQVKAVGKTFHKNCLRCVECGTSLDSSKLRDHDGEPFCVRCYSKLHGPQGSGYALLGKAGG
ncbi:hypothetical protein B0H34DRAFT_817995 [Crassisporium funariophilum]|nr:hypothetical protein B0H34DRAFT_817995 [Crassisporium funariophilum]